MSTRSGEPRLAETGPPRASRASGSSFARIAIDATRHALPLARLYLFGGDTASYLLLTAFDLSLGMILIVALAPDRKPAAASPARLHWIFSVPFLALFFTITAGIVTAPIAAPVILFGLKAGVDWLAILSSRDLWISVGVMATLASIRALAAKAQSSKATNGGSRRDDLDGARGRSRAASAAQWTMIASFVGLGYLLIHFGRILFYAIPPLYAAVLVFYDARPDLARSIFPDQWQTKGGKDSDAL
jgi:hypothetical protein